MTQRAVGLGARQWRHQVVDDHRLRAPFGLGALARVVDDEGVDVGERPEQRIWPALRRQPDTFARQPLEVAVLAHVDHRIGGKAVAQPEVERQVPMRRHRVRVVIHRAGVQLVAPGRLDADEGQAIAQAGDHHPTAAEHRILFRRPHRSSTARWLASGSAAKAC